MTSDWSSIRATAQAFASREPLLASFYHTAVIAHEHFYEALAFQLSSKLAAATVPRQTLDKLIADIYRGEVALEAAALADLNAYLERDPACTNPLMPLLYFKGFLAIQSYRIANRLWRQQRRYLACFLQSRASAEFDVDIHPAATLGTGLMFDHATGIVIGETAIVGDNVSMLHAVSLGGSGISDGKRHPTVGDGVLISVGAKLLGDITIGAGVKVGGGSVVLGSVPDNSTVVGVPAKIIGQNQGVELPAFSMDQYIPSNGSDVGLG